MQEPVQACAAPTSFLASSAAVAAFGCIAVRLDLVGERLSHRRSADDHLDVVAQAGFLQGLDGVAHDPHRGGQQGRHTQNVRFVFFDGFDESVRLDVFADVCHLEAGAFAHHGHQVLADVVQVTLDGAEQDFARSFGTRLRQQRPQNFHRTLHGLGRAKHLGDEHVAGLELGPYVVHACHQALVQDVLGAETVIEGVLRLDADVLEIALNDRFGDLC